MKRSDLHNIPSCEKHPWVPLIAGLLADGFAAKGDERRQSLILFLLLCLAAHSKVGRVLQQRDALAEILGMDPETTDRRLRDLEEQGAISIRTGGPFLVLSIRSWPGRSSPRSSDVSPESANVSPESGAASAENPPSTPPPGSALQVNKSDSESAYGNSEQNGTDRNGGGVERGLGRDEEEALVDRVVEVLGAPEERVSYASFCRKYPRRVIEEALHAVERQPAASIRKSRGALFTYLVKKLSQER